MLTAEFVDRIGHRRGGLGAAAGVECATRRGRPVVPTRRAASLVAARRRPVVRAGATGDRQSAAVCRLRCRRGPRVATLAPNGDVAPPIRGRALDGTGGTQTIHDTDGGALDGDATWDRAMGPLQFIPTTWAELGRDGDGDGRADPDNLYDAALTAVAHLCLRGSACPAPGVGTRRGGRGV